MIDIDSDFDKIGQWSIEKMGLNPFLYFSYQGSEVPKFDKKLCKDTDGDCYKWI